MKCGQQLLAAVECIPEAASGSCGLRTVNLYGQIASEYASVVRECPTRVSRKSVPQECPTRVSCKSVLQDFSTRVSDKSGRQECPTRAFYKSVSYKSVKKCVGACFRVRVCMRVRGFHLVCNVDIEMAIQVHLLMLRSSIRDSSFYYPCIPM